MQNDILRVFDTEAEAIGSMRRSNRTVAKSKNRSKLWVAVVQMDTQWAVVSHRTAISIGLGYILDFGN
jgi:broad specificity phosphatase PhoE